MTHHATMVRTHHHKFVVYHGDPLGELYDLDDDPDCQAIKQDLLRRLTDRMAWTVDPLPPREADY